LNALLAFGAFGSRPTLRSCKPGLASRPAGAGVAFPAGGIGIGVQGCTFCGGSLVRFPTLTDGRRTGLPLFAQAQDRVEIVVEIAAEDNIKGEKDRGAHGASHKPRGPSLHRAFPHATTGIVNSTTHRN
jgi:hypothetical protein